MQGLDIPQNPMIQLDAMGGGDSREWAANGKLLFKFRIRREL
jgi:hypothetical protein